MKASPGSVLSSCLALAALRTLSSCASFGPRATVLTPRSEAVCDPLPPAPVPPIPDDTAGIFAAFRQVLGLYHDEAIKGAIAADCRAKVRAENAEAARRAR